MGDEGLEQQAQNPRDSDNSSSGGAHLVQSAELRAHWGHIRTLISNCPDLLPETRQSLIVQGDHAAVLAHGTASRKIQHQRQNTE